MVNRQQIDTTIIRIPQKLLATNEFEFIEILDMKGIEAGKHTITVELFGLWGLNEKLDGTIKELIVDYTPQTRMTRLVRVPGVKSIAGKDLVVTTKDQNEIYENISKTHKNEQFSKRDNW